jgi:peptide/nickel transport system substrate-binding protein
MISPATSLKKILSSTAIATLFLSHAYAGKQDDTLVVADREEVVSFDQYYGTDRIGIIIGYHIYDRLLYRDPVSNEIKPMLATEWRWVDDLTLEFKLREGVKFHDGETFEAEDVVFTLQHAIDPASNIKAVHNVEWIESVEAVDDRTVLIRTKKPFPAAPHFLAGPLPIYGKDYYEKVGPEGMNKHPIGTGPYKVERVEPGIAVHFLKNDSYWEGSPRESASIGKLVLRTIPDINTQMAELMTGGVDWIWKISKDQAASLTHAPNVTVGNGETMRIGYLTMDASGSSGDHPLKKKEVRQAIAHAIDRQSIRSNLMIDGGQVLSAFCYPKQFGCDQNVTDYGYDPEKAKELLSQAGYADGFDIQLNAHQDSDLAEAMIGNLAQVGIRASLNVAPYTNVRDLVRSGKSAVAFMTHGSYSVNDVSAILPHLFGFTSDDVHRDEQVRDDLSAAGASLDQDVRRKFYTSALARISDEMYALPLWTYPIAYAHTSDLDFTLQTDEIPRFETARWKQ